MSKSQGKIHLGIHSFDKSCDKKRTYKIEYLTREKALSLKK